MSQNIPNMMEATIAKIRDVVDVNTVVGDPITIPDGTILIPVSKVSVGVIGGGSDYVSKNENRHENPFGGGAAGGVSMTPVCFIVIKEGNVRMISVPRPPRTAASRFVERVPDIIDQVTTFIDSHTSKKEE